MYMYACVFSKFPDQNTALVPRLSRSHEVLQLIILVFDPALVSSARLLDSLPLASFSVMPRDPPPANGMGGQPLWVFIVKCRKCFLRRLLLAVGSRVRFGSLIVPHFNKDPFREAFFKIRRSTLSRKTVLRNVALGVVSVFRKRVTCCACCEWLLRVFCSNH